VTAELVRCVACGGALDVSAAGTARRACGQCGAPVLVDAVAIDVVPHRPSPVTWGARAMQSRWLARVYEAAWRPLAFGISTGFGAPRAGEEIAFVAADLAEHPGPWLDLSCGPGLLTRALVARATRADASPSPANAREGSAREERAPEEHARGVVVGVDLSRAMLVRARAAAPSAVLVRADAASLPFAAATFGAVANLAALDLYADAARVIAESARVLAAGGRWIASTFVDSHSDSRGDSHEAGSGGSMPRRKSGLLSAARSGSRRPTERELASAVERAGLVRFGVRRYRGYVIAWADKG
jgi:SAM-dependent methyltransferase